MSRYNLLDETWIPVIRKDTGQVEEVSMMNLFQHAETYQALAGDMETQNFAMLRIFLAVLVTIFTRVDAEGKAFAWLDLSGGDRLAVDESVDPEDADDYMDALEDTWNAVWQKHAFPKVVLRYLQAWHDSFFLLDETRPFMQVTKEVLVKHLQLPFGKETSATRGQSFKGKQMNRLISESANKEALFAPMTGKEKSRMTEAELTRWLIMMQGYVGTADKGKFPAKNKVVNSKGWLFDLGGIYVAGQDLFETLWLNTMLSHTEGERYTLARQTPCWESEPEDWLEKAMRGAPQTNLASLYTAWSRAVYIAPSWSTDQEVSLGAVKVTEIAHDNAFLEPMTLWRCNTMGDHKGQFTPRVHRPEEALWRSFGLITMQGDTAKRPGIIDYYHAIEPAIHHRLVALHAVGMQSDGNATSWLPVDELADVLYLNEVLLTDTDDGGWSIRIRDTVEDTKDVIQNVYRPFVRDVAELRDIERSSFVENHQTALYHAVDAPFRDWLYAININESKDAQIGQWKDTLRHLVLEAADQIMLGAAPRDFIWHENNKNSKKNIITAYNWFKRHLNQKIPPPRKEKQDESSLQEA